MSSFLMISKSWASVSSTELTAPHRVHKVWYLNRSLSLSFPLGIEHTPVSTMRSSHLQCTHKIGLGVVSEGAEVEGLCLFFIRGYTPLGGCLVGVVCYTL